MAEVRIKRGSLVVGVYDDQGNLLAELRLPHDLAAVNRVRVVQAEQSDWRWETRVDGRWVAIEGTPPEELDGVETLE